MIEAGPWWVSNLHQTSSQLLRTPSGSGVLCISDHKISVYDIAGKLAEVATPGGAVAKACWLTPQGDCAPCVLMGVDGQLRMLHVKPNAIQAVPVRMNQQCR